MPELVSYDRGIHIRGTPLWFDSQKRKEHSVLTSLVAKLPPGHTRVLASMTLANTLGAVGYKPAVLPVPWDKWVVYGGQKLKFIDFGGAFGTGGALITGTERILVAGVLPIEPKIKWQLAEHLVVSLPAFQHRGAQREQVTGSVCGFAQQATADGVSAGILVDSLDVGHFMVEACREAGLEIRPIGLLAKALEEQSSSRKGVTIGMVGARMKAKRICWVDAGLRRSIRDYSKKMPDATFRLKWYADLAGIKQALRGTGAKRLSVIGLDSGTASELSEQLGSKIHVRGLTSSRQLELAS